MMKPKSKRPLAVWSTAAFTTFVISLSPVATYAAHLCYGDGSERNG